MPCRLWFESLPTRSSGTDDDGLDHSEKTAGADGEATGHPLQVKEDLTAYVT